MGRYSGTLHRLVDNACSANSKTTWSQVMHYIEGHTVGNNNAKNPRFDSPLPSYTSPSVELEVELFEQQGPKRDETPLKIAVKAAPSHIVAALCHLGPEAASMPDCRDRLPLHWACRRTSRDPQTEILMEILIKCYPEGLIHRDDGGRTPLHWLFWYHAPTRSPRIVEVFGTRLPEQKFKKMKQPPSSPRERYPLPSPPKPSEVDDIPCSAFIVPDARHGAVPLHYAVMEGASKEALKVLLNGYPGARSFGDRKNRTPLAWYLGAGHLTDGRKHICGESNDPNAAPWWEMKLSASIVQLLLSSRVARKKDDIGRVPLHWACHLLARNCYASGHACLSMKALQCLQDHHIDALITKDKSGKTPLQVFFDVIAEQQDAEYRRLVSNRTLRDNIDLRKGGPTPFSPPIQLIEMLLKSPDSDGQDGVPFRFEVNRDEKPISAAFCENGLGGLPIHTALKAGASSEIIKLLIKSNPTSLVHTTEETLQTPLCAAFCSAYTAPLQPVDTIDLLMQAYVTSRHGTFMDGRLALKMEDIAGKYPIHYACQNQASLGVLKLLIQKFPRAAVFQNADGDLPVHCLLSSHLFEPPENGVITGATLAQPLGFMNDREVAWQKEVRKVQKEKIQALMEPLVSEKQLRIASSAHGMTPLHIAVAFDALPYRRLFDMLSVYPEAARRLTTQEGYEFSPMDLHELHRSESGENEEWSAIRELLFAFHPTLETYRKKEEVLDAGVKLIRNEILGNGSFHLDNGPEVCEPFPIIELSETLSAIEAPEIDCAYRPKIPKRSQQVTKKGTRNQKSPKASANVAKVQKKSIYDDDLDDGRYLVSPENSVAGDDDSDVDDFLSSEEEEEYFSDESSSSDSLDAGTSIENSTDRSSWRGAPSGSTLDDQGTQGRSSWDKEEGDNNSTSWAQSPKNPHPASAAAAITATHNNRHERPNSYIEEKKEDGYEEPSGIEVENHTRILSDVALRIWTFFLLYNDSKNPNDCYVQQVEAVFEDMEFDVIQRMINIPVPDFGLEYLPEGTSIKGITLGDIASPKAKALIHRCQYFAGRYEIATDAEGVLLHRTSDNGTVYIRAVEHVVSTEEYKAAPEIIPGTIEESIWDTGEVLPQEEGYMQSKFKQTSRNVYIKLTKHLDAYENEVLCRKDINDTAGSTGHVVPLIQHFNRQGNSRDDRQYKMDQADARFEKIRITGEEPILISDYPYAMVFPYSNEGDLYDKFYHHGIDSTDKVIDIASQVGKSLQAIHAKGVVHGNVSMRSVTILPTTIENDLAPKSWALTDLTYACRLQSKCSFLGGISHDGCALFSTGRMPPEMFVKLSSTDRVMYDMYWETIQKKYEVEVDKCLIEPHVNAETGETFVLRCHYVPKDKAAITSLPPLPYKLVPARESNDIWCFGLLLYTLCTGGRPLFPTNVRNGHMLDYGAIITWNKEKALSTVFEHVKDSLAQDILLHLLSPLEDRASLTMETVLAHPFFATSGESPKLRYKIIDQRTHECDAYHRKRQRLASERSDADWLAERTVPITCWNFDMMARIHNSPYELCRKLINHESDSLVMPCSFILLPYKLSSKNKKGRLAPTSKRDVERAERLGIILLALSKACHFAVAVQEILRSSNEGSWTASKLVDHLSLSEEYFAPYSTDLSNLASEHVESFRSDPMSIVYKVVERRINDLRACFHDSKRAFLYLVDGIDGIPLTGPKYAPYPIEIQHNDIEELFVNGLPFMHICAMYVRGVKKSISGLVRLIFEAAYPHVPPTWAVAGQGLDHKLDDDVILREVMMIQATLAKMTSSKVGDPADNLRVMKNYFLRNDPKRSFAGMKRVESAGSSLWATEDKINEIVDSAQGYGFKEALDIQHALEAKLKLQEIQIRKMREEMERMAFRKELNLEVPDSITTTTTTTPTAVTQSQQRGPRPPPSPRTKIPPSPKVSRTTVEVPKVEDTPIEDSGDDVNKHESSLLSSSPATVVTAATIKDDQQAKSTELSATVTAGNNETSSVPQGDNDNGPTKRKDNDDTVTENVVTKSEPATTEVNETEIHNDVAEDVADNKPNSSSTGDIVTNIDKEKEKNEMTEAFTAEDQASPTPINGSSNESSSPNDKSINDKNLEKEDCAPSDDDLVLDGIESTSCPSQDSHDVNVDCTLSESKDDEGLEKESVVTAVSTMESTNNEMSGSEGNNIDCGNSNTDTEAALVALSSAKEETGEEEAEKAAATVPVTNDDPSNNGKKQSTQNVTNDITGDGDVADSSIDAAGAAARGEEDAVTDNNKEDDDAVTDNNKEDDAVTDNNKEDDAVTDNNKEDDAVTDNNKEDDAVTDNNKEDDDAVADNNKEEDVQPPATNTEDGVRAADI